MCYLQSVMNMSKSVTNISSIFLAEVLQIPFLEHINFSFEPCTSYHKVALDVTSIPLSISHQVIYVAVLDIVQFWKDSKPSQR